ncbi:MAG TPA: hypothetical protein VGB07_36215 [Blastocatellia bacterium]
MSDPMQERLKQQAKVVAHEAGQRLQREIATTVKDAAEEIGRKVDSFFTDLLGDLRSDLRKRLRGNDVSGSDGK